MNLSPVPYPHYLPDANCCPPDQLPDVESTLNRLLMNTIMLDRMVYAMGPRLPRANQRGWTFLHTNRPVVLAIDEYGQKAYLADSRR